ncbi:aldose epimerase family protein [Pontiella agarivorans]|uniref:Aldose 1-epimerase n=1 Tax=Pontiella agarivorans TaxID=3038953 RepID=A0ABU5MYD3_9BACT|nr:aldose epimerase family protein [Pontiella agarivorans]MDZ8119188.1 galactose mutarotase [Pontiella agarivorans]
MPVEQTAFGKLSDGRTVPAFIITNAGGYRVKLSAYGAAVVSVEVPDAEGAVADVVLGFDDVSGYENDPHYIGRTIGRVANRIGGSCFELDGKRYPLPANEGKTHLHGGPGGFHRKIWNAEVVDEQSVRMFLESPDGDQGYPGTLSVELLFTWTNGNELKLEYRATADRPTVCDLTHHTYFNLAGSGSTLDHRLSINASKRLLIDERFVPTGETEPVSGSVYDFRIARPIREYTEGQQGGHGEYYVLDAPGTLAPAAEVTDPGSRRSVQCFTDQRSLVFYEGFFVGGDGKGGQLYRRHSGFCLETQNHVNAVNIGTFPSARLEPGGEYRQICVYRFGVDAREICC